jgi:hypothetical protein
MPGGGSRVDGLAPLAIHNMKEGDKVAMRDTPIGKVSAANAPSIPRCFAGRHELQVAAL